MANFSKKYRSFLFSKVECFALVFPPYLKKSYEVSLTLRINKIQNKSIDDVSTGIVNTIMQLKQCLSEDKCPDHSRTGFGPKGDKQCEISRLFEGMKDNQVHF